MDNSTRRLFATIAFGIAFSQLFGCASSRISLNDSERNKLRSEPVIHVVHYVTPAPRIDSPKARVPYATIDLHSVPSGEQILERLNGYDPTLDITKRFVATLGKQANLSNLKIEKEAKPWPVVQDTKSFKDQFENGLVLEVWIPQWNFTFLHMDWKTYAIGLNAYTRLSRVEEGTVLWNTGHCGFFRAGNNFQERIVLDDLNNANKKKTQEKIKNTVARIGDTCADILMKKYYEE